MKLQVPESAVSVTCHSSEEHQISFDILNVSSQTPAPQMTKPMPSPQQVHYMKSHEHFMPSHPTLQWQQHATGAHTPAPLLHCHTTSVRCWRSPHPPNCRFVTPNNDSSHVKPIRTFHFLHGPEHILQAPQAPLCQVHAASARRCPHVCPWATHCATARSTSRPEGEYADIRTRCTMMCCQFQPANTTDMKRGKIKPTDTDRQPYAPHKHKYCHFRKTYSNHA